MQTKLRHKIQVVFIDTNNWTMRCLKCCLYGVYNGAAERKTKQGCGVSSKKFYNRIAIRTKNPIPEKIYIIFSKRTNTVVHIVHS